MMNVKAPSLQVPSVSFFHHLLCKPLYSMLTRWCFCEEHSFCKDAQSLHPNTCCLGFEWMKSGMLAPSIRFHVFCCQRRLLDRPWLFLDPSKGSFSREWFLIWNWSSLPWFFCVMVTGNQLLVVCPWKRGQIILRI